MLRQRIRVEPLDEKDIGQIVELMQAQNMRQDRLDPRLHTSRGTQELEKMLHAQLSIEDGRALVAHDSEGRVRGYALPSMWKMAEDDEMIAFFTKFNGSMQYWILPAPSESDAIPVAEALLDALTEYWQQKGTYGDLVRWPSSDPWIEPVLFERRFLVDSQMALRSLEPLGPSKRESTVGFHARLARPEDEDALLRLYHEELAFHVPYTQFVRMVPALESGMRERLRMIWARKSVLDGAPLVVVIERNGEVVAMAENELLVVQEFGGFSLMPAARYGYLNNVSVSEKVRGQGVGRLLVEEVFTAFSPYKIDAYLLWYSQDNPLASGFWPHLGFRPLWKTYQRRNRDDGVKVSG
jgi:ribosomal protein S18 acetylase RimI-like enzyme